MLSVYLPRPDLSPQGVLLWTKYYRRSEQLLRSFRRASLKDQKCQVSKRHRLYPVRVKDESITTTASLQPRGRARARRKVLSLGRGGKSTVGLQKPPACGTQQLQAQFYYEGESIDPSTAKSQAEKRFETQTSKVCPLSSILCRSLAKRIDL